MPNYDADYPRSTSLDGVKTAGPTVADVTDPIEYTQRWFNDQLNQAGAEAEAAGIKAKQADNAAVRANDHLIGLRKAYEAWFNSVSPQDDVPVPTGKRYRDESF